jgi:tetratricopeptide (TPR) repeat protein
MQHMLVSHTTTSDDEALADEYIARSQWSQAATALARIIDPSVRVLNKRGCLLREHLHDLQGASQCHEQALITALDRDKAETLAYLGIVRYQQAQYENAYRSYSDALHWYENEMKQDPTMIAHCLVGMGNAKWALTELVDALTYTERALNIREHEIKPRNDFDVAACLGNIGNILHDQGELDRALTYATRTVQVLTTCGQDDPRLAAALNNLGGMYQSMGNIDQARNYFQRALNSLHADDHPYRTSTLNNIARLDVMKASND